MLTPLLLIAAVSHAAPPVSAPGTQVKIGVNRTGVYRVTGAGLTKAGVRLTDVHPDKLFLSCQGQPVACRVLGAEGGRFAETSAVVFYGEGLDTPYTDTNVYWLTWGGGPGLRMGEARPVADAGGPITSHRATLRLEENHVRAIIYTDYLPRNGAFDGWVWAAIAAGQPLKIPVELPHLVPGKGALTVRAAVRGRTVRREVTPDHHLVVDLNDQRVGEVRFDGQAGAMIEGEVPAEAGKPGANTLTVTVPGDTGVGTVEQAYLDWIELTYDRDFVAEDGAAPFSLPPGAAGTVAVSGLKPGVAELYELTDPAHPLFASLGPTADGRATVGLAPKAAESYLVTTDASALTPSYVKAVSGADLRSAEARADLVVIAYDDFCDALGPLVKHREEQGLKVALVPVSRVYDEFSDGIFTPVAIRDFLAYAYEHWAKPAPRYVLLVGDASYDYRDYLKTGVRNCVPAYEVPIAGNISTASDAYFACVDGPDHVPEMAVGRLPVSSAEETANVVAKILRYETAPPGDWQRRVVFVADHDGTTNTPGDYETLCASLADLAKSQGLLPTLLLLRQVDPALPANVRTDQVRQKLMPELLKAFGEGAALVEFQGHGNETFWARQRVLTLSDLAALKPATGLPLCVDISCFTGWFDKPDLPGGHCIDEALLLAPERGVVACVAPSGLGGLNLDLQLVPQLMAEPGKPIGDLFNAARRRFLMSQGPDRWDPVENYNLLGDPLLRLRLAPRPPVAATKPSKPPTATAPAAPGGDQRPTVEAARAYALGTVPIDPSRPLGELVLPGGTVNTQARPSYRKGTKAPDPEGGRLFVVQFRADQEAAGKQALQKLGVLVLREVKQRAAIVKLRLAKADELVARPEVQWLGYLEPWMKVAPAVMAAAFLTSGPMVINLEGDSPQNAEVLAKLIEQAGGKSLPTAPLSPPGAITLQAPARILPALARDERVVAIAPPPSPEQPKAPEPPKKEVPAPTKPEGEPAKP